MYRIRSSNGRFSYGCDMRSFLARFVALAKELHERRTV
jgi:hypothetical protein